MPAKPTTTVQSNIRSVAELDRTFEQQRTLKERIGGFSSSVSKQRHK